MRKKLAYFLATLTLAGCVSRDVRQSGIPGVVNSAAGIYVAPFHNATSNPSAGRAMTDLTATTLAARGLPLIQSEQAINQGYELLESGRPVDFLQIARSVGATHAVAGSVHEYRFKSDLDGAPTVGLTMRLVEVATGQTVWQGSSSRSSGYYSSLSGTAQSAIDSLVEGMSAGSKAKTITNSVYKPAPTTRNSWWSSKSRATTGFSPEKPQPVEYEQIRRRGETSTSITTTSGGYTNANAPSVVNIYGPATLPAQVPVPANPGAIGSQWTPVR
jgi:TolB-like protein